MTVAGIVPMRVVGMSVLVDLRAAIVPEESQEQQPKHIEGCQKGGESPDQPIDPTATRAGVSLPENLVFAPEAREWRDARDRQRRDAHGRKCYGDVAPQTTHLAHVLLTANGVNDRTRSEEEQPLKECMCHQMKNSCGERAHAAGHKHIAELRDG